MTNHSSAVDSGVKNNWINTYTGIKFYPTNPRVEDVNILDIAHALGQTCRYGGHTSRYYSVAEHSIHLSEYLELTGESPTVQMMGLMHDSGEAYLLDIPSPVKVLIPEYIMWEDYLLAAIAQRFKLYPQDLVFCEPVKEADLAILYDEASQLFGHTPDDWHLPYAPGIGVTIHGWSPEEAKQRFLMRFGKLQSKRGI